MQLAFMVSVRTECEDDSGRALALKLTTSQRDELATFCIAAHVDALTRKTGCRWMPCNV